MKQESITEGLIEKTVDALDAYMEVLNKLYEEVPTSTRAKEIEKLANLTNRWLTILESDDDEMYDF